MEGVILYLLGKELKEELIGKKIDNVYKRDAFSFIFSLGGKKTSELFVNFSERPAIFLVSFSDNEDMTHDPSWEGFLSGWVIRDIIQNDWNRVYKVELEKKGSQRHLYMEFTGRFSNMILTDDNDKIITALKPMGFSLDSAKRIIRGGFEYRYPEFKTKYFPWEVDLDLRLSSYKGVKVLDIIIDTLKGIGRNTGKDMLLHIGYDPDIATPLPKEDIEKLLSFLNITYENWRDFRYAAYILYGEESRVTLFPLANSKKTDNLSQALFEAYETLYARRELSVKKNKLLKLINDKIEALKQKVKEIEKEIELSERAEEFLQKGELLKINLSKIRKGNSRVEVVNYYKYPPEKEWIELDSELSPKENVDLYFKKYAKYKRGKEKLKAIYDRLKKEYEKLEKLREKLIENEDLSEVESVLSDMGFIKKKDVPLVYKGEKIKLKKFLSPDGFLIFVGRSAKENEMILKIASPNDYWLHVRDIPGSHVIIKREGKKDVPFNTIRYAASIAAYFSKARNDTNVGVDYTLRKYVRPIKGGGPGFVTFREEKTIYVNPYDFKKAEESNHSNKF